MGLLFGPDGRIRRWVVACALLVLLLAFWLFLVGLITVVSGA